MEIIGRVPPHNLQMEQALLGAMLQFDTMIDEASDIITKENFYKDAHREIYDSILTLHNESKKPDMIQVSDNLETKGVLDSIGGFQYINDLMMAGVGVANISHYAEKVKQLSLLRNYIRMSANIMEMSYAKNDPTEFIDTELQKLMINESGEITHIREISLNVFDEIEKENVGEIKPIDTGFTDLDKGLFVNNNDFVIIAARPSMGKTAFALAITDHRSMIGDHVAIFSLEMTKERLVRRMINMQALVSGRKSKTGKLDGKDWEKLGKASAMLSNRNIYIDDSTKDIGKIISKCRRLKREGKLDCVMIDYLQLLEGPGNGRYEIVSNVSRKIKSAANELKVPFFVLCQLSRKVEERHDKRPVLSDLRESGQIEQDADIITFLYRDEYYYPDSEKKNIAEVIVSKQRDGNTGRVELAWVPKYTLFANLEKYEGV